MAKVHDHPEMAAFALRLPPELKSFIESEAKRNRSSQNSEIVRSIREKFDAKEARSASRN
jgi:hypothetical protein